MLPNTIPLVSGAPGKGKRAHRTVDPLYRTARKKGRHEGFGAPTEGKHLGRELNRIEGKKGVLPSSGGGKLKRVIVSPPEQGGTPWSCAREGSPALSRPIVGKKGGKARARFFLVEESAIF